jgi:hypothetical protein
LQISSQVLLFKPGLQNLEKNLKPKQDVLIFPKMPPENREDGEILLNDDLSPNYTL